MDYTIKAHPTKYDGVLFRSRLESRWAAFFNLVKWQWDYEPIDLRGWVPDFRVIFPCTHSECNGSHTLLAEVKPYYNLNEFAGHPCTKYPFGYFYDQHGIITDECIPADASASFGINPSVTEWEMSHGCGGGIDSIDCWIPNCMEIWKTAGNIVQWLPRR